MKPDFIYIEILGPSFYSNTFINGFRDVELNYISLTSSNAFNLGLSIINVPKAVLEITSAIQLIAASENTN